MDTLTHSLVGVALSRAFFKRRVAYATTALVIAANLPDLDFAYAWPGIRLIEYHRGMLHSVWMIPVWALLVALVLRWYVRRHPPRRLAGAEAEVSVPAFGRAFLLGAVAVSSHILLDWSTSFGIRLFAPFSHRWYALDFMPTFDPWLELMLVSILVIPLLLGMITAEVGARQRSPHRVSGVLALVVFAAWMGLRGRQHAAALDQLNQPEAAVYFGKEIPLDWGAFPNASNPFDWRAVVDLPSRVLTGDISSPWNQGRGFFHLQRSFTKPPLTPAIQQAELASTARIFLHFARFPFADSEIDNGRYRVSITDMRFARGQFRPGMHVVVEMTRGFDVRAQWFTWHREHG